MSQLVLVEKHETTAVVTLNRPDSLNALSKDLMTELVSAFRTLQQDRSVRAAVLTGAGRAFCAGLDLKELASGGLDASVKGGSRDIQAAILDFDRPVIGAINGVAATGGFELALWCDMLVAADTARFADTHARVGLISGWGLSQRLQRIVGINRARELSLTGNFLSAQKAEQWGLVNHVVAADELIPTCLQLGEDIAKCDAKTLVRYKRVINEGAGMDLSNALNYERTSLSLHAASQSQSNLLSGKDKVMNRSDR